LEHLAPCEPGLRRLGRARRWRSTHRHEGRRRGAPMKRRLLLLFAVASIAALASAPLAGATPPAGVTITIDETFHASAPFVTGDYRRLKGTGTFTETQNLNYQGVGTGSITLVGTMHTD